MKTYIEKQIDALTKTPAMQEAAREWLILNDPEAAEYWAACPADSDFIEAVQENLRDFDEDQVGDT